MGSASHEGQLAADEGCAICLQDHGHHPGCPAGANPVAPTGGCLSCSFGIVPCGDDGGLQACNECAVAGAGFNGPQGGANDICATAFAFYAIQCLEAVRELLYPAGSTEASWSPDTADEIARLLAFLRPSDPSGRARAALTKVAAMTAVDRYEALSAAARRRGRAWMVIPEYRDGRIFRAAISRAHRLALSRKEIWSDGARRCNCGCVPCAMLTAAQPVPLRHAAKPVGTP